MNGQRLAALLGLIAVAVAARVMLEGVLNAVFSVAALGGAGWVAWAALLASTNRKVVLRLWGLTWTRDEAC